MGRTAEVLTPEEEARLYRMRNQTGKMTFGYYNHGSRAMSTNVSKAAALRQSYIVNPSNVAPPTSVLVAAGIQPVILPLSSLHAAAAQPRTPFLQPMASNASTGQAQGPQTIQSLQLQIDKVRRKQQLIDEMQRNLHAAASEPRMRPPQAIGLGKWFGPGQGASAPFPIDVDAPPVVLSPVKRAKVEPSTPAPLAAAPLAAAPPAAAPAAAPLPLKQQHDFCEAAKKRNLAAVKSMLEAEPRLVNVQPSGRWTALHQFAQAGDVEAVNFLLARHAALDAKTKDGKTPLDVADARCRHLLREGGAGGGSSGGLSGCAPGPAAQPQPLAQTPPLPPPPPTAAAASAFVDLSDEVLVAAMPDAALGGAGGGAGGGVLGGGDDNLDSGDEGPDDDDARAFPVLPPAGQRESGRGREPGFGRASASSAPPRGAPVYGLVASAGSGPSGTVVGADLVGARVASSGMHTEPRPVAFFVVTSGPPQDERRRGQVRLGDWSCTGAGTGELDLLSWSMKGFSRSGPPEERVPGVFNAVKLLGKTEPFATHIKNQYMRTGSPPLKTYSLAAPGKDSGNNYLAHVQRLRKDMQAAIQAVPDLQMVLVCLAAQPAKVGHALLQHDMGRKLGIDWRRLEADAVRGGALPDNVNRMSRNGHIVFGVAMHTGRDSVVSASREFKGLVRDFLRAAPY